jgi:hypothetical protein
MALAAIVALLAHAGVLCAQTVSVGANPSTMTVSNAPAGAEPVSVGASTSYSIMTNQPNKIFKVTGQLNANMPAGLTLTASMTVPSGATSLGAVALSTTPADIVTGISRNTTFSGTLDYVFTATAAGGVVAAQSRTVLFTIMRAP